MKLGYRAASQEPIRQSKPAAAGILPSICKKLVRSISLVALIGIVLVVLSAIVTPRCPLNTRGTRYPHIYGYAALTKDTLDVLVVGDSGAQSGISPLEFAEHGIRAYDSCCPLQKAVTSSELIDTAFRYQHPRVVFYEVNNLFRNTGTALHVKTTCERIFPIFRDHDNWKQILNGTQNDLPTPPAQLGYRPNKKVRPYTGGDYMAPKGKKATLTFWGQVYLQDMKRTCENNGAQLVLVSVPNALEWSDAKHHAVAQWAKEHNITYLDLNLPETGLSIDWSTDTRDGGKHLNTAGAQKVTVWLSAWLHQTYGIGAELPQVVQPSTERQSSIEKTS